MVSRRMIAVGGASFILGALAFLCVFTYLAVTFDYPDVLDGNAAEVLPRLRDGGQAMRAVWAIYAFLPLLFVPGAVGAFSACPSSHSRMTVGLIFATLASLTMCLGLIRWPSIHWELASVYEGAGPETKTSLDAVFGGLNLYLGNFIGEFLGETALAAFFLLTGFSMLDEDHFPTWVGWAGVGFSVLFFFGAFRNVTKAVQLLADVNNALLPLWMIVLGAVLCLRSRRLAAPSAA